MSPKKNIIKRSNYNADGDPVLGEHSIANLCDTGGENNEFLNIDYSDVSNIELIEFTNIDLENNLPAQPSVQQSTDGLLHYSNVHEHF